MPSYPRRRAALLVAVAAVPLALVAATTTPSLAAATHTASKPAVAAAARPAVAHPVVATTTATAAKAATRSSAHPFSDPVWYPIHINTRMDCVHSNPGCPTAARHKEWNIDQVQAPTDKTAHPGVYAMGAGILHVVTANSSCPLRSPNFGEEVWIDHGGGVITRYGHLAKILVKSGTLVAAGQEIALMGDTGKSGNCGILYLDYQVRHYGISGAGVQIKTLKACGANSVLTYPTDVTRARYATWNQVPKLTTIPAPAAAGRCLPTAAPRTATRATGVRLTRSGTTVTARWTKPSAGYRVGTVLVEFSTYHSSVHRWDLMQKEKYLDVSPTRTSYAIRGLSRTTPYRVRISFHNAAGWSQYGAWVKVRG